LVAVPGGGEHSRQGRRRVAISRARLPVVTVIENLEDLSVEEVMEQFDVTREQIAAVLDFVARSLRESEPADADPV
jgi:uncharacterized protein (DUF433 family)